MTALPREQPTPLADQRPVRRSRRSERARPGEAAKAAMPWFTIRSHVLTLAAALVLTPVALVALAGGATALATTTPPDQGAAAAALGAVLGATVVLGGIAASTAFSVVGAAVAGTLYGIAPGAAFLIWPDTTATWVARALEPVTPVGGQEVLAGILWLGSSASLLLLGLSMALVAAAASIARNTPEHRGRAVLCSAAGLLLAPLGIVLFEVGSADLTGSAEGAVASTPLWLGVALLSVVALTAASSVSGLVAGALIGGIGPGFVGLFLPEWIEDLKEGLLTSAHEALSLLPEEAPPALDGVADLAALRDPAWLGDLSGISALTPVSYTHLRAHETF